MQADILSRFPKLPLEMSRPVAAFLFAIAAFLSRFKYIKSNLLDGLVYFADPDCYTRLYRVKRVLLEHAWFQPWHSFENYPYGIPVHTTALLDWLLALLALVFKSLPATSADALDWAGFYIGPLLAAWTAVALYYLTLDFKPAWARLPLLWTYILSPMLIWSTASARPDHQCLIVSLLILAFALELKRWEKPEFHLWAGLVWGLALWTSLFEPLLFLMLLLAVNLCLRRGEDRRFWIPLLAVAGTTLLLEGIRWQAYLGMAEPLAKNWMTTIGELQSENLTWTPGYGFGFYKYGFAIFLLPLLLLVFRKQKSWRQPAVLFLLLSTALSFALAMLQVRWGYFFAAASMFSVFLLLPDNLKNGWKWSLAVFFLLIHFAPMLDWNISELEDAARPSDMVEIRKAASQIKTTGHSILAPWWFSPALLYYSGAPIVASSSHESIDGIADSARFFTTRSFLEAEAILNKRKAGWVLLYLPERLYRNSQQILTGKKFTEIESPEHERLRIVSVRLFEYIAVPASFRLAYASRNFLLYHYEMPPGSRN